MLRVDELEKAVVKAKSKSKGLDIKEKAKLIHSILDSIASKNNYYLKLRKK
ncbi:MAG: hypothetical protein H8E13_03935 [Actinobacteria bacterium]|nr:hypothetical protein [Actinomycetota bacterium]